MPLCRAFFENRLRTTPEFVLQQPVGDQPRNDREADSATTPASEGNAVRASSAAVARSCESRVHVRRYPPAMGCRVDAVEASSECST
jgi:hypothetical protein